jgi:hypothetical protein
MVGLPNDGSLWHLVCQKRSCQGAAMAENAENKHNLTFWHLVCQKLIGNSSGKDVSPAEEIGRADTETNQGAATDG